MRICPRFLRVEHHNEEDSVTWWRNLSTGQRGALVALAAFVALVIIAVPAILWMSDDNEPQTAYRPAPALTTPAAEVVTIEPTPAETEEPHPAPSIQEEYEQPDQRFDNPRLRELYEAREADPNFFCGGDNALKHPYAKSACPNAFAAVTLSPDKGAEITEVYGGRTCDRDNRTANCTLTYSQAKRNGDRWELELAFVLNGNITQFGGGLWVRSAATYSGLASKQFQPDAMHRTYYAADRVWHILVVWHNTQGSMDTAPTPYNLRSWNDLCGTKEPCGIQAK